MATIINGTTGIDRVQDVSIHEVDINADVARLGVGQTWQDVTASRVLGTTYTNTTGKPIMVSMYANTNDSNLIVATCSGIALAYTQSGGTTGHLNSVLFIVPNNTTYSIASNQAISKWSELR